LPVADRSPRQRNSLLDQVLPAFWGTRGGRMPVVSALWVSVWHTDQKPMCAVWAGVVNAGSRPARIEMLPASAVSAPSRWCCPGYA